MSRNIKVFKVQGADGVIVGEVIRSESDYAIWLDDPFEIVPVPTKEGNIQLACYRWMPFTERRIIRMERASVVAESDPSEDLISFYTLQRQNRSDDLDKLLHNVMIKATYVAMDVVATAPFPRPKEGFVPQ